MFTIGTNTNKKSQSSTENATHAKPGRRSGSVIRRGLLAGVFAAGACGAVHAEPNIGFCTHCSNAGFAWAAEQAAPPTIGTHPVYVIDTFSGEVRYFDVMVWWDCGGNLPQSVTPRSGSVSGDDSGAFIQSNCTHKEAMEGSGDPTIIMHMEDAHDAVMEFTSPENLNVDSRDIDHSGDSAVDLVGPHDGPAGLARANLQNGLADYLESLWGSILFTRADLAQRFANRFIGSSDYFEPLRIVTVNYPDGTTVQVEIEFVSTGPDGSARARMKVVEGTARLPNGQTIPYAEGHFDGFEFEGDTDLVDALWQLADLYGIPVTGPDGGGGGRIACTIVDGEIIQCVVLPQ